MWLNVRHHIVLLQLMLILLHLVFFVSLTDALPVVPHDDASAQLSVHGVVMARQVPVSHPFSDMTTAAGDRASLTSSSSSSDQVVITTVTSDQGKKKKDKKNKKKKDKKDRKKKDKKDKKKKARKDKKNKNRNKNNKNKNKNNNPTSSPSSSSSTSRSPSPTTSSPINADAGKPDKNASTNKNKLGGSLPLPPSGDQTFGEEYKNNASPPNPSTSPSPSGSPLPENGPNIPIAPGMIGLGPIGNAPSPSPEQCAPAHVCFAVDTSGDVPASDWAQIHATVEGIVMLLRTTAKTPSLSSFNAVTYAAEAKKLDIEMNHGDSNPGGRDDGRNDAPQQPPPPPPSSPQPMASSAKENVDIGCGIHACANLLDDGMNNNVAQYQKWIIIIARHGDVPSDVTLRSLTIARAVKSQGVKLVVVTIGMSDATLSSNKLGEMSSSETQYFLKVASATALVSSSKDIAQRVCDTCSAVIGSSNANMLAHLDAYEGDSTLSEGTTSLPYNGPAIPVPKAGDDDPHTDLDQGLLPIFEDPHSYLTPAKAVPLDMLTELMKSGRCAFFDCVQCDETLSCHVRSQSVAMDMDVCGIVYDMAQFCLMWTHTVCGQSCTGIGGVRCYTDSKWHQCPTPTGADCKHMPLHTGTVQDVASYVVCRDGLKTKISCLGTVCEEGECKCARNISPYAK